MVQGKQCQNRICKNKPKAADLKIMETEESSKYGQSLCFIALPGLCALVMQGPAHAAVALAKTCRYLASASTLIPHLLGREVVRFHSPQHPSIANDYYYVTCITQHRIAIATTPYSPLNVEKQQAHPRRSRIHALPLHEKSPDSARNTSAPSYKERAADA